MSNPTGKGGFLSRCQTRAQLAANGRRGGVISAQNRAARARARAVRHALEVVREQQRDGRQASLPEVLSALWTHAYTTGRHAANQRQRAQKAREAA